MVLKGTYKDSWYDLVSRKMVYDTGTIKVTEKKYNDKVYWDVKWYNSSGIVVQDGMGFKSDKAFDKVRELVKKSP